MPRKTGEYGGVGDVVSYATEWREDDSKPGYRTYSDFKSWRVLRKLGDLEVPPLVWDGAA